MALPFAGLTMLEATRAAAPPGLALAIGLCGRVFADLGARVLRWIPADAAPIPAPAEHFLHRGKQAIRASKDLALLHELVGGGDAVIADAALSPLPMPRRACALLSMDGTDDPRQSEFTIEARSGLLDMVGDPAREPLRLSGHQTAYAAGLAAFTGLAAALSSKDGAPHVLRVSLLETAIWLNWKALAGVERSGTAPRRLGPASEWPVLRCADGYVAMVYRTQEWPKLLTVMADPALRDPRFATVDGRRQNRLELNALLQRQIAGMTRKEVHALSMRAKLPLGPIWQPAELRDDAQMIARDAFDAEGLPRLPVLWNGHRLVAAEELAMATP